MHRIDFDRTPPSIEMAYSTRQVWLLAIGLLAPVITVEWACRVYHLAPLTELNDLWLCSLAGAGASTIACLAGWVIIHLTGVGGVIRRHQQHTAWLVHLHTIWIRAYRFRVIEVAAQPLASEFEVTFLNHRNGCETLVLPYGLYDYWDWCQKPPAEIWFPQAKYTQRGDLVWGDPQRLPKPADPSPIYQL